LRGIETVNIGPGEPLLAHAIDEWVNARKVAEAVKIYTHVAERLGE
jgi:acetylornithine deacetylase/succinyl-diaminopimelate desuccinylase-like protein